MPATEGEILIDGEEANPKAQHLVCVSGTDLSALAYRPRNVAYGMEVKGVGKEGT